MANLDKVLYTAQAHTTGGRDGASRSSDGKLDVKLTAPTGTGTKSPNVEPTAPRRACSWCTTVTDGNPSSRSSSVATESNPMS